MSKGIGIAQQQKRVCLDAKTYISVLLEEFVVLFFHCLLSVKLLMQTVYLLYTGTEQCSHLVMRVCERKCMRVCERVRECLLLLF